MSARQRRVNAALVRYRLLASTLAGVGVCAMVAAALVGLTSAYAVAAGAMGLLLVVATLPLMARAATLERQLLQLEAAHARMCELQAARSNPLAA